MNFDEQLKKYDEADNQWQKETIKFYFLTSLQIAFILAQIYLLYTLIK